jgi:hypothetical protein
MRGAALQPSCGQAAARLYSRSSPPSLVITIYLSVTIADRGVAGRWPKFEAVVGSAAVVVLDVLLQDAPEVALVDDQKPVQRLPAS